MKKPIRFIRYCIVGGLTTLLDLFLVYFFHEAVSLPVLWAVSIAFLGALVFSYVFNRFWTFADRNNSKTPWDSEQFLKFFFVSAIGFNLTILVMYICVDILSIYYLLAKIIASALVLAWNFLGNSLWTFPEKIKKQEVITPLEPEKKEFQYELSVVIPAFNEEKRLEKTLLQAQKFFNNQGFSYEIIVVDDGSTDKTSYISEKILKKSPHRVITLEHNKGKGFAVKTGVLASKGRYILFCDADGATPFTEFTSLKSAMGNYHIAIGSRYLQKDSVKQYQPFYRIFSSRVINFFAQIFLIDGITDTQCGFKIFRSDIGKQIFKLQKIERFAFDIEMLILARKFGYRIAEIPVEWFDQEGSKFSAKRDGIKTIYDFIRVKFFMMFRFY